MSGEEQKETEVWKGGKKWMGSTRKNRGEQPRGGQGGRERQREREREGGGGRLHVGACETGDSGAQSVRERERERILALVCVGMRRSAL